MEEEILIAVHKNHHGDIISFQTSEGRIISYRKAWLEADSGKITGVSLAGAENSAQTLIPLTGTFEEYPRIY
ncbi:DUF3892 domain-containing protein [Mesobacillus harenae]|uniref:DUF3892 domain-containing protein n=1 Tax=Mesobacillus harenae TaxID=2213203 RepID=UPI0015800BFA|nr:DUF3892 domain-containing protein [Mesobacillus harenae]